MVKRTIAGLGLVFLACLSVAANAQGHRPGGAGSSASAGAGHSLGSNGPAFDAGQSGVHGFLRGGIVHCRVLGGRSHRRSPPAARLADHIPHGVKPVNCTPARITTSFGPTPFGLWKFLVVTMGEY